MNNNNTTKTVNAVTFVSPVQQEIAYQIHLAKNRNMVQVGAEFWNDDTVIAWGVRIGKPHDSKPDRVWAKLSRATLIAPIADENKGHRMSGAFKAIEFSFDVKTGTVYPRFKNETPERIALLQKWATLLVEKYIQGMHKISNGEYKRVRGYNPLFKTHPKFGAFVARYNGAANEDDTDDTPIVKDSTRELD